MKVLFVCIGNTCRSPMAEAILKHLVLKSNLQDWYVDSAGLRDWNVGEEPQARGQQLLKQHGLKTNHLGRMDIYLQIRESCERFVENYLSDGK